MDKNRLNKLLSSLMVFYIKLNNMHWNVKGSNFFEIHEELEKLYDETREHFDAVAEKIVMGGGVPLSTMKESLENSLIKELPSKRFTCQEVCKEVVSDCSTILKLAEEVSPSSTVQPMLDEIFMTYDKKRWMFGSVIE